MSSLKMGGGGCHKRLSPSDQIVGIDSALPPSQLWPDSSSSNQCCILDINPTILILLIVTLHGLPHVLGVLAYRKCYFKHTNLR